MQKPSIVILGIQFFFITLFLSNTIHQYDQIPQQIQEVQYIKVTDFQVMQIPLPWEIKQLDEKHLKIVNQNNTDIIVGYPIQKNLIRKEKEIQQLNYQRQLD